jgi:anti-anti-sigma factor
MPPSNRPERAPAVIDCGPLKVALSRKARNRLLVELRGELDAATAGELETRLYLPRSAKVDLDLSGLTFVDAAGLRFLTSIWEKTGGKTYLLATSPAVDSALELAREA